MAQSMIVGILPESDPKAIETALAQTGLDAKSFTVVTKCDQTAEHDLSVLDFVHVGRAQDSNDFSDDLTRGTGMMTDSGGTAVPGIGGRHLDFADFSHGGPIGSIAGLPIPPDQIQNYFDALSDGRTVVAYPAADDVDAKLRAAGVKNVQVF